MSASLHVEHSGNGLLPLACLHGWAMNLRVFDPLRASLEDTCASLALDLPGHGRSPWNPARADFALQATDIRHALPGRCVLLGWSLGAQFALQIAAQSPERVAALVLVAATPRFEQAPDWSHGLDTAAVEGFRDLLRQDMRQLLDDFIGLQLRGSRHAEAARQGLLAALQDHGLPREDALAADLDILGQQDLREKAAGIAVPTLVLAGQHDRVTPPAAGRWLAGSMPDARYHEVARAGHVPFLSHVGESATVIRDFLEGLGKHP